MLELIEHPPAVIFTTAFDEYAMKAFETHAVDYLLKPFSKERFGKALEKFFNQGALLKKNTEKLLQSVTHLPSQSERVVVKTGGKIKIIPVMDILYLEASDDYVKVHTREGTFLKNKTMSYFEDLLPNQNFIRVHRSFIVNVSEIPRIDNYEKESHLAILKTAGSIPVSKNGYLKLKELLGI
jgi:two-component system LytT family response regulator